MHGSHRSFLVIATVVMLRELPSVQANVTGLNTGTDTSISAIRVAGRSRGSTPGAVSLSLLLGPRERIDQRTQGPAGTRRRFRRREPECRNGSPGRDPASISSRPPALRGFLWPEAIPTPPRGAILRNGVFYVADFTANDADPPLSGAIYAFSGNGTLLGTISPPAPLNSRSFPRAIVLNPRDGLLDVSSCPNFANDHRRMST